MPWAEFGARDLRRSAVYGGRGRGLFPGPNWRAIRGQEPNHGRLRMWTATQRYGASNGWSDQLKKKNKDAYLILWWGHSNAAVVLSVRPCVRGPFEHDRAVAYFFVELGRHVHHDKKMNPIDFGGQRSRSQWTYKCMEISL